MDINWWLQSIHWLHSMSFCQKLLHNLKSTNHCPWNRTLLVIEGHFFRKKNIKINLWISVDSVIGVSFVTSQGRSWWVTVNETSRVINCKVVNQSQVRNEHVSTVLAWISFFASVHGPCIITSSIINCKILNYMKQINL